MQLYIAYSAKTQNAVQVSEILYMRSVAVLSHRCVVAQGVHFLNRKGFWVLGSALLCH